MKRKSVITLLASVVMALSVFTGCGTEGNMSGAQAITGQGSLADTYGIQEDAGSVQLEEGDIAMGTGTEKGNITGNANAAGDASGSTGDTASVKPGDAGSTSAPSQAKPNASAGSTGSNTGNANTGSNTGNANAGSNMTANTGSTSANTAPVSTQPSSQPQEPAHVHAWADHTATKEEWVPNIVTVDDYEEQEIVVGVGWRCGACGQVVSIEDYEPHSIAHLQNGERVNGCNVDLTEKQQVKVGSHEEDHGHYETVTYVDYQYCSCGATR